MRTSADDPGVQKAIAEGRVTFHDSTAPPDADPPRRSKGGIPVPVVPECWCLEGGRLTFAIGIPTASESNGREWRNRSYRTQQTRRLVSRALGKRLKQLAPFADHFHGGGTLRIVFTRLGGRPLDKSNIPSALKAVEDAVALMLGADDGSASWDAGFDQEPGGLAGVRISFEEVDRAG